MVPPDDFPRGSPEESPTAAVPDAAAPLDLRSDRLSAGRILAGRFRIRRFIARGGMGEVYEAEDLELREQVALKTILPAIAADPGALERFKTEVHLARKVTHPSACRIFDVFRDRGEAGGQDVTFLTMELLRGETLADHLSRSGRLSPEQALPIVEQVAGALEAAHRAGVIHRDLKAANVMLVPAPSDGGEVRAVVTDFGLARRDASVEGASVATSTAGVAVGTPAYMAPEQIEGGPITAATDIYALGVLMYEMVTGSRPFQGPTPWAVMMKRLEAPPPSPRSHVSGLDPAWESVVMRCLERDPSERFASSAEVVRSLRGETAVPPMPARRAAGRASRRIRWAIAAAAIVVFAFAAALGWWLLRQPASHDFAAARRSVAVLGLRNLSGRSEAAWLAVALAEMLTSEMGAGEAIRTISGESVARLRAELPVSEFDSLARDTLARLRARLGTDLLVLGSYTALGDRGGGQIRLDVRLQDTSNGEVIASVSQEGTEAALFDLVSRTGVRLREKLGIGSPTAAQRDAIQASLPKDPLAARLYSEGLSRLRLFDTPGARDLLEQAKAKDPAHALTRAALARAWTLLGYDRRAEEESKQALDLSTALSREDRLSIEGQYSEAARQWNKAIEIYTSLVTFFPDNLEYGLRLASVQQDGGKGQEAFNTLNALRKLPAPLGSDPRIDLTEAVTARYLSESQRGVDAAVRAGKVARATGAKYVLARARFEEGSNLQNLGKMDEAVAALTDSENLFRECGDRRGVAASLNNRGLVLLGRGDLDGTEKVWTEALAVYRSLGQRSGEVLLVTNLGSVDYERGNATGARKRWEQALPIYRELNEPEGEGMCLINIASVLGEQGDIAHSREMFEQALALYRKIGHKSRVLSALGNIAVCQRQQGDVAAAERSYQEVMALWKDTGDKEAAAPFIQKHGDLLLDQGDASGARAAYNEALKLRDEMKQEGEAADVRLSLVDLDVDEGRAHDAEGAARGALEVFRRLKSPDGEARARSVLARIAAAGGKPLDAKTEAAQAQTLAAKSANREMRLAVDIACARVLGGLDTGDRAAAIEVLRRAQAEAVKTNLVPLVFESRLALGEIELRSSPASAKAELRAVQREAEAQGFKRIALRAASAR
jgi:eukaryotic-like serine/threonine-protein kinase